MKLSWVLELLVKLSVNAPVSYVVAVENRCASIANAFNGSWAQTKNLPERLSHLDTRDYVFPV
jgi:hypothetical protein